MPIDRNCVVCGKGFSVKANRAETAKTCSNECRGKLQAQRYARERPTLKCDGCGNSFQVKAHRVGTVRYCSSACKTEANRVEIICACCGEPFWVFKSQKSRRSYCSNACRGQAMKRAELQCETCGKAYSKVRNAAEASRFCSKACLDKSKLNRVDKTCEHCGTGYSVNGYRADASRFCSEACKWKCFTGNEHWESPDGKTPEGYKRSGTNGLVHRDVMLAWMLEEAPDHRFIVEEDGEKRLASWVDVHHIDRDRSHNERGNLLALLREAHSRLHHSRKKPDPGECWPPDPPRY
ncbi:hypothetical protein EQG41_18305 [Billgrantia azerbaijanica]|nr:hypothetical protein EQG41_18305 [Halomonas azerbaijanica]